MRFGALTGNTYRLAAGDLISWEGSITFDLSTKGLTFGDLKTGSAPSVQSFSPLPLDGRLVITLIPEPAPWILLPIGFLAAWLTRIRRSVGMR